MRSRLETCPLLFVMSKKPVPSSRPRKKSLKISGSFRKNVGQSKGRPQDWYPAEEEYQDRGRPSSRDSSYRDSSYRGASSRGSTSRGRSSRGSRGDFHLPGLPFVVVGSHSLDDGFPRLLGS